jgi:class 3 adenylate cyclase
VVEESTSAGTRGFLFADLRGYTQYVERHGDAAAAELLGRYRALVRGVLPESGGAEVKTEGDSFYIVFPTARQAVLGGLALVERTGQDALEHPEVPIAVGVGIHAGEITETAEGYVGSAVNIAARICAQAGAGEVLVSDTVRSLTRTGVPLQFVARGRRRLKGIDEPIALFAVQRPGVVAPELTGAARLLGRRRPLWIAAAAAVVVAASVLAVNSGLLPGSLGGPGANATGSATPTPGSSLASSPTPAGPTVPPLAHTEMPAGTYAASRFQPAFTVRLPAGWATDYENAGVINLHVVDDGQACPDQTGPGGCLNLAFARILTLWEQCGTKLAIAGSSSREMVDWLQTNEALTASDVRPVRLGTASAVQLDLTRSPKCTGDVIALFQFESEAGLVLLATDEHMRLLVADIGVATVTVIVSAPEGAFVEFGTKVRSVLDSVVWTDT